MGRQRTLLVLRGCGLWLRHDFHLIHTEVQIASGFSCSGKFAHKRLRRDHLCSPQDDVSVPFLGDFVTRSCFRVCCSTDDKYNNPLSLLGRRCLPPIRPGWSLTTITTFSSISRPS